MGKLYTPTDDYLLPGTYNWLEDRPYRLLYHHIHTPWTSTDNKLPALYKFPLCLVALRYDDCYFCQPHSVLLGILSTSFNSFCDLVVNPIFTDMETVFAVHFVTHGIYEHLILAMFLNLRRAFACESKIKETTLTHWTWMISYIHTYFNGPKTGCWSRITPCIIACNCLNLLTLSEVSLG